MSSDAVGDVTARDVPQADGMSEFSAAEGDAELYSSGVPGGLEAHELGDREFVVNEGSVDWSRNSDNISARYVCIGCCTVDTNEVRHRVIA